MVTLHRLFFILLFVFVFILMASTISNPSVSATETVNESNLNCTQPITRSQSPDAYAIAVEVFKAKFVRSHEEGLIDDEFYEKIRDVHITFCDEGTFEATGYPDGEIVVDLKLFGFTFLQARAMIVGGYLSYEQGQEKSFYPYDSLLEAFFSQDDDLQGRAHEIPMERAVQEGMDRGKLRSSMSTVEYQTREQTMFLGMLYFLAAHELCHYVLDHHEERNKGRDTNLLVEQELEADACALNLINKDEKRSTAAPVSAFGAIAVLGSQAILANVYSELLDSDPTHPSPVIRLDKALGIVKSFIESTDTDPERKGVYRDTVKAMGVYFRGKIEG